MRLLIKLISGMLANPSLLHHVTLLPQREEIHTEHDIPGTFYASQLKTDNEVNFGVQIGTNSKAFAFEFLQAMWLFR